MPLRPLVFLFIIDFIANVIDYGFHVYLGRSLLPGDFAAFQAVNSALLVVVAAFGVTQPVVARLVAERESLGKGDSLAKGERLTAESAALIRQFLGWSALAGGGLAALVWLLRGWEGRALNVPAEAITLGAVAVFFILLRPVVVGALQGAERFGAFGAVRLAFAGGRVLVGAGLVTLGWGLRGAVTALPAGQMLAVLAGMVLLGRGLFGRGRLGRGQGGQGQGGQGQALPLRLMGWAFLAYAAHTLLLNADMLWANRVFTGEEAGLYAAVVLLRRILLLLPGAATVILLPRAAAEVAQGRLPDRVLGWALGGVALSIALLTMVYFAAGPELVRLAFGEGYPDAGLLPGWMGVAVLGYGIASVWLNLFLATEPGWFVLVLWGAVGLMGVLLPLRGDSPLGATSALIFSGWVPALGGGALYWGWLRPRLKGQFKYE